MKFDGEGTTLKNYEVPEWFKDAKFGIFIHWGIYSVPAYGDEWYGHWMYTPNSKSWAGDDIYTYHKEHYPNRFGYKDFIPNFKGERFNASEWVDLFKKAGATYVMPVAMHHDSFALYDSKLTKWNSSNMGPMRDVIWELATEVRKASMKFGVSNHFAENWWFFPHHNEFDTSDPSYAGLYNRENKLSEEHVQRWYDLTIEQIDTFQPDLLYFDFEIEKQEFEQKRRKLAAYYYNKQLDWNKGVVLNYKYGAFEEGEAVLDVERGQLSTIRNMPWQACTSISNKSWGFITNDSFKTSENIITNLVDIVSKNGCLLLNVGPKSDGTIPTEQQQVLLEIGEWLQKNGEAIYNTRPWIIYGEGPTKEEGKALSEKNIHYTSEDIRFTQSKDKNTLYAIVLAKATSNMIQIKSLNAESLSQFNITNIVLMDGTPLKWNQTCMSLVIELPNNHAIESIFTIKISLK